MKPNIVFESITPDRARKLLGKNTQNRKLNADHVRFLSRQMTAGEFPLTGDSIKFDPDMVLLDGQHRLHAIIEAGISVTLSVAYGVSPTVRDVVDTGSPRSLADTFQMIDGLPDAALKMGSLRVIVSLLCYNQTPKLDVATARIVLSKFEKPMEEVTSAVRPYQLARVSWVIGSLALAASSEARVFEFARAVGSGALLDSGHPALVCRDWLMGYPKKRLGQTSAVESLMYAAYSSARGTPIARLVRTSNPLTHYLAPHTEFSEELRVRLGVKKPKVAPVAAQSQSL